MFNCNLDIKEAKKGVPNWAIAVQLGVHETTFYRWLRTEMDPERKRKVFKAIEEVKREMKAAN